jgi:hypothetical protein
VPISIYLIYLYIKFGLCPGGDNMNNHKQNGLSPAGYLHFKHLPDGAVDKDGKPALNKYSSTLTRGMVDYRWRTKAHSWQNMIFQGQGLCCLPPECLTTMRWKTRLMSESLRYGGKETRASKLFAIYLTKIAKNPSMHRMLEVI